jgi:hypothetical protein
LPISEAQNSRRFYSTTLDTRKAPYFHLERPEDGTEGADASLPGSCRELPPIFDPITLGEFVLADYLKSIEISIPDDHRISGHDHARRGSSSAAIHPADFPKKIMTAAAKDIKDGSRYSAEPAGAFLGPRTELAWKALRFLLERSFLAPWRNDDHGKKLIPPLVNSLRLA